MTHYLYAPVSRNELRAVLLGMSQALAECSSSGTRRVARNLVGRIQDQLDEEAA